MTSSRQLAAIMFTDIVGYTKLMGKDSAKALELVRKSKEIQQPLVDKHNGQWLKEMGDGALAKFGTALDAVNCAVEIQELARAKFDGKLRIGIHLGDITIENEDVYGDGVNVASRLESIADPGGIYISESIEKAIRGQTDVQAKYLGEAKLKNVAYGVRTYAVQGVGLPVPEIKEDQQLKGHFWAEVQRRGVVRSGATYVVLSLLAVLLLPYAESVVSLPQWSMNALQSVLIAGYPVAMYLAWNYERSPEGFVRTSSKESWQNPYSTAQRKPLTGNFIIAGMALIIVVMYFYPRQMSSDNNPVPAASEAATSVLDKSIAVIPFVNMSNDPDQEYFSDGMMEEILNHLVKIKDLQVVSRTSVMQYKGTTKTINEIAQELGVATVLEGSVRKSGNRLRITVQLIDGGTNMHLWSETYDRKLDDVFAIQSEVAQRVASTLHAEIHPEVRLRIERHPTNNTDAYSMYLQARYHLYYQFSEESNATAHELLEEVIRIDPEFADAYVELAGLSTNEAAWSGLGERMDTDLALTRSDELVQKALEIDPMNLRAHQWLAASHLWMKWDFDFAERQFKILNEINPNYAHTLYTDFLLASGHFESALVNSERAIKLHPMSASAHRGKVLSLGLLGQTKETLEAIDFGFGIDFKSPNYLGDASRACLYLGEYEQVVDIVNQFLDENAPTRPPRVLGTLAIAYYHLGQTDQTEALMAEIKERSEKTSGGSPSFYFAMIYAQMGEIDTAFEWLNKAYEDHEVEMYWLRVEPPFDPLRSDPRWQEMLDKVGFPE